MVVEFQQRRAQPSQDLAADEHDVSVYGPADQAARPRLGQLVPSELYGFGLGCSTLILAVTSSP